MFGPRRQFSWEEHDDGGAALSTLAAPSLEDDSSSRKATAQELARYAEGLMAAAGAAPAEYAALVHQATQEQLGRLAHARGWLAAALQGREQQMLSTLCGSPTPTGTLLLPVSLAAAAGAAPAEMQQALEQVQELDALLEELANRAQPTVAATAGGPLGLSAAGSSAPPQEGGVETSIGAPHASNVADSARDGSLDALLRQERARQQHAALVQRALQEGEGSDSDHGDCDNIAVLELAAVVGEHEECVELRQVLGPKEEKLLEVLLHQDDSAVQNDSAENPFDLTGGTAGVGGACSQEVRRLVAIDARLAELQQQEVAELGGAPRVLQGPPAVALPIPGLAATPLNRAQAGRTSAEEHGQEQHEGGKGLEQEQEAEAAAGEDADGVVARVRGRLHR